MLRLLNRRRGVASVIGTILFVLVLMVAIGAQVYISGLQAQSNQIGQQAQQVANMKGQENLQYTIGSSGLTISNIGAATSKLMAMLLSYRNGTVYNLNPGSTPPFTATTLPAETNALVGSMVPSGTCTPGTAACVSRYNALVANPTLGSIGLVTSFGSTYWSNLMTTFPPNSCTNGVFTLSTQVSPAGSGYVNPGSVTAYCYGQLVPIEAFAAPGYTFSSWTGTGTGSYTGNANPATAAVNSLITETANFVAGAGPPQPSGQDSPLVWVTTALQSTNPGGGWIAITPFSFTGTANTLYQVTLSLGYYQSVQQSPGMEFGVSGPAGATMFACGSIAGALPASAQNCTSSFNTPIGVTTGATYCTSSSSQCWYQVTIYVTFGSTGGAFNAEFQTLAGTTGTLVPDSVMTVTGE
ncbi:MAG: hypothetical protein ABSB26_03750 [Nitrososphaerales archaeon]|jgi:FlaG/FlaF family flagellin (archaellin)